MTRGLTTLPRGNQEPLSVKDEVGKPSGELEVSKFVKRDSAFPFSALTLLIGRQEGHPACRKTGCWFVGGDDLTGALHVLQLQLSPLTTSIILGYSKFENGDILVPLSWPLSECRTSSHQSPPFAIAAESCNA